MPLAQSSLEILRFIFGNEISIVYIMPVCESRAALFLR
jgi:hypothetical protein